MDWTKIIRVLINDEPSKASNTATTPSTPRRFHREPPVQSRGASPVQSPRKKAKGPAASSGGPGTGEVRQEGGEKVHVGKALKKAFGTGVVIGSLIHGPLVIDRGFPSLGLSHATPPSDLSVAVAVGGIQMGVYAKQGGELGLAAATGVAAGAGTLLAGCAIHLALRAVSWAGRRRRGGRAD